jgi:hypothetical protein
MANLTITNLDIGSVELWDGQFNDEIMAFAGADEIAEGTILARTAVATAITITPGTNTGDGTCTLASVIAGDVVPAVGDYKLECVEAITNGGRFKLEDPSGQLLTTQFFTLTDGATDFAVADSFTLTTAADGKLGLYSPTGLGGLQVPKFVLTNALSVAGAGNVKIRPMVSGQVERGRLVIDDGSTVTDAILDQLRDFTILNQPVTELNILDNQ